MAKGKLTPTAASSQTLPLRFRAGVHAISTSIFIREYLKTYKEDYPYNIWRRLKEFKKTAGKKCGSPVNFNNTIWNLSKLGLIKQTGRVEPADYPGKERHYYALVGSKINDPAWNNPRKALYPASYDIYH